MKHVVADEIPLYAPKQWMYGIIIVLELLI
jgi:hypothetical protein